MAVTGTSVIYVEPLPEPPQEYTNFFPFAKWKAVLSATGDASGGAVTVTVATKPATTNASFFLVLTSWHWSTNDTTAGQTCGLRIAGAQWENYDAQTIDIARSAMATDGAIFSVPMSDRMNVPFVCGRPNYTYTGNLVLYSSVNADGKYYSGEIRGFLFRKTPLLNLNQYPYF